MNVFWLLPFLFCALMGCTMDVNLHLASNNSDDTNLELGKGICGDGSISSALPIDGDRVILAGEFSKLGECAGGGLFFDPQTNQILSSSATPANRIIGYVQKAISDGAGGWYVAVGNGTVGGKSQKLVARFNADGSLNSNFVAFRNFAGEFGGERIHDMVLANGKLILGGSFGSTENPHGGPVDLNNGNSLYPVALRGEIFSGEVSAVVSDGGTGWYLGGHFNIYRGEKVSNLIHVDQNGNRITSFNPKVIGAIKKMHLSSNTLYLGGEIISINGQARRYVGSINATTGAETNWAPQIDFTGDVRSFAVSETYGKVYVAGEFSSAGGQAREQIVEVDKATGAVTALDFNITYGGSLFVEAVFVHNDILYIGGQFTHVLGQARSHAAAIDINTGTLTAWNPNVNSMVFGFAVSPSATELFMTGYFSTAGGQARQSLAAVNFTTGAATAFNPGVTITNKIFQMAATDTTIYLHGAFQNFAGQKRLKFAAIDRATGTLTSWDPHKYESWEGSIGISGDMAVGNSAVFVIDEQAIGAKPIGALAILDATTGAYLPFDHGIERSYVNALAVSPDQTKLYVGGKFKYIMGQQRNGLAEIDLATLTLSTWSPSPETGFVQEIHSMQILNDKMYVGGYFLAMGANNLAKSHLALLDIPSGNALAWDPQADAKVSKLLIHDGTLYVTGDFSTISAQARYNFAAFKTSDNSLKTWDLNLSGWISINGIMSDGTDVFLFGSFDNGSKNALKIDAAGARVDVDFGTSEYLQAGAFSGGRLFLGGQFSSIRNENFSGVAVFNLQTSKFEDLSWNLPPGTVTSTGKLSSELIYFTGYFVDSGLGENYGLLIFNLITKQLWKFKTDAPVSNAQVLGNKIYFNGDFSEVDTLPRMGLAAVDFDSKSLTAWDPGADDQVNSIAVHDNKIIVAGGFDNIGGQAVSSLTRLDPVTGLSDGWTLPVDGDIDSLMVKNDRLYMVGDIYEVLSTPHYGVSTINLMSDTLLPKFDYLYSDREGFFATDKHLWLPSGNGVVQVFDATSGNEVELDWLDTAFDSPEMTWFQSIHENDEWVFLTGYFLNKGQLSQFRVIRKEDGVFRY